MSGIYKYLKHFEEQPIWESVKFDDRHNKLDTHAIWKNPNPNQINADWMIGKVEDLENNIGYISYIRGIRSTGTPDTCKFWSYFVGNYNKNWTSFASSRESGINVTCIKGKKFH